MKARLHLKLAERAAIRRSTAAWACSVVPSGAEIGLHLTPAVERRSNSCRRWGGWPPLMSLKKEEDMNY
ncbi:hypothetical protein Q3G72_015337 [Acer saccharum]|nr:hypothetical protein Q3G72_015337 [Acer saccharum]